MKKRRNRSRSSHVMHGGYWATSRVHTATNRSMSLLRWLVLLRPPARRSQPKQRKAVFKGRDALHWPSQSSIFAAAEAQGGCNKQTVQQGAQSLNVPINVHLQEPIQNCTVKRFCLSYRFCSHGFLQPVWPVTPACSLPSRLWTALSFLRSVQPGSAAWPVLRQEDGVRFRPVQQWLVQVHVT